MSWTPARIRALLDATGMTQADLARAVPCSTVAVWNWVHGKKTPRGLYAERLEAIEREAKGARK